MSKYHLTEEDYAFVQQAIADGFVRYRNVSRTYTGKVQPLLYWRPKDDILYVINMDRLDDETREQLKRNYEFIE